MQLENATLQSVIKEKDIVKTSLSNNATKISMESKLFDITSFKDESLVINYASSHGIDVETILTAISNIRSAPNAWDIVKSYKERLLLETIHSAGFTGIIGYSKDYDRSEPSKAEIFDSNTISIARS
jgi:hypothetical protein